MMLLLVFAVVFVGLLNILFYEYRVHKNPRNDIDIGRKWIAKKLKDKYK